MKAKFQKRQSGYSSEFAQSILDYSKPIHSLSVELEPQMKFVDNQRTGEVAAYKAWFSQSGLPPFEVKFENQIKLPPYLSVVTFDDIQACEVSYNIYFRANDIKEVK
ncbi:hypothetical protein F4V47_07065 [Lactococcus garvieae subsp. garvieae]|uniref:hypothetical protein n=1 Tax=Lactococcus garvieae TaxID=1363 RepID=UPI0005A845DB|nr:hypothetical protein [Lactococcus garvieae]KAA8711986.1 hypothetical protein F4V47_07065 [Lactococcus garvieae subsp. garvieae]MDG6191589.1 hypothetical protein [Lactococcus garvieae]PCS00061.1 hypothetical protein RU85_GL000968 [Lactococcus garvieae]QPR49798.1 hypothetical protein I6G86_05180 [Lactococcus garvieae]